MVFNVARVKNLVDKCSKYRKKWSEQLGRYLDEPLHDINSNYGDMLQYLTMGVEHIESAQGMGKALEDHRKAVRSRQNQF